MKKSLTVAVLAFVIMLQVTTVAAQQRTGALVIVANDSLGAIIAGVEITATNQETGFTTLCQAGDQGTCAFREYLSVIMRFAPHRRVSRPPSSACPLNRIAT
jgi:hypothetical protein